MEKLYFKVFKETPDLSEEGKFCASKEACSIALGYIKGSAFMVWFYGMSSDVTTLHLANNAYFQESAGITEEEIEKGVQELKNKKYLCVLDEEANVWGLYEYPQIKGVWTE